MLKGTMMYYLVDIASRVYTKKFFKKKKSGYLFQIRHNVIFSTHPCYKRINQAYKPGDSSPCL